MLVVVDVPVAADEPPVGAAVDAAVADPRVLWAVAAGVAAGAAACEAAGAVAGVAT